MTVIRTSPHVLEYTRTRGSRNISRGQVLLVGKSGDHVDCGGENDGAEEVRQQRMAQCCSPNLVGLQIGIGDLKGHPDSECKVGKFEVGGFVVLIEIDTAVSIAVVQAGVAEGEKGMDEEPRQNNAGDGKSGEEIFATAVSVFGLNEYEGHRSKARGAGKHQKYIAGAAAGVFPSGMMRCACGVESAHAEPHPEEIDQTRSRPPSDRGICPKSGYANNDTNHNAGGNHYGKSDG